MFIKLTGRSNTPVLIRTDRIEVIDGVTIEGEDFTGVGLMGKEGHFVVRETPEQIMEMIEKCLLS